jgi:hypothetical protein
MYSNMKSKTDCERLAFLPLAIGASMRSSTTLPFSFSTVDLPSPLSPRSLGEHTADVLRQWLNCSDVEIDELKHNEVLGISATPAILGAVRFH